MMKACVKDFDLLSDLLFGPADMLGGSRLGDSALERAVLEEFPNTHCRVVRDWMIIDVMVEEKHQREIESRGLLPSILYAQNVVFDSRKSFPSDRQFRSCYATSIEGCFFETSDTLYILAGRGSRKFASVPAVSALDEVLESDPVF
jgi:hypothetical protein